MLAVIQCKFMHYLQKYKSLGHHEKIFCDYLNLHILWVYNGNKLWDNEYKLMKYNKFWDIEIDEIKIDSKLYFYNSFNQWVIMQNFPF